jgi:hypothetical protein
MKRRLFVSLVLTVVATGALTVIAAGIVYFVMRDLEVRRDVARLRELEAETKRVAAESSKLHVQWRAENVGPEGLPLPDRSFCDDPRQMSLCDRYKAAVAEHDAILDRHPDWNIPRLSRTLAQT